MRSLLSHPYALPLVLVAVSIVTQTPGQTPGIIDDHAGHDHAEDDHTGHDHAENDHTGHDHAENDHAGHDYAEDDHTGHNHAENDHTGHDYAEDDHTGHDHDAEGEKTAALTVWNNGFEVFVEHPYLVAGDPAEFIVHVTNLDTGLPRREGPVSFIFWQDGRKPRKMTVPKPASDGVYLPRLTFDQPGDWLVSLIVPVEGQERTVPLSVVKVYATRAEADAAPAQPSPEGFTMLKEQQWKLPVITQPVEKRTLTRRVRLPGSVVASPQRQAQVSPPAPGLLLAPPGGFPNAGDRVEQGQVLALIQPLVTGADVLTVQSNKTQVALMAAELRVKRAEAEAEEARAKVALEQATLALKRVRSLAQQNVKSQRELEEAEFERRKAEADINAAKALQQAYRNAETLLERDLPATTLADGFPVIELRAPISGIVVEVGGVIGEHVLPEQTVFQVLDASVVLLQANLPEVDINLARLAGDAVYTLQQTPGVFFPITGPGGGRLARVGQSIDSKTRTLPVYYELPNPDQALRVSMALEIYVETDHAEETLAVPESAIVEEAGRPIAFVQVAGETMQRRDLTLGFVDKEFVQVLAGLAEGERVVVQGAYATRLAAMTTELPAHGHAH